jgi:drug/metabolite transporter (DMT)-like permease
VFAALAGWLLLGEILSFRGLIGCMLMFAGMLTALLHDSLSCGPLRNPPNVTGNGVGQDMKAFL